MVPPWCLSQSCVTVYYIYLVLDWRLDKASYLKASLWSLGHCDGHNLQFSSSFLKGPNHCATKPLETHILHTGAGLLCHCGATGPRRGVRKRTGVFNELNWQIRIYCSASLDFKSCLKNKTWRSSKDFSNWTDSCGRPFVRDLENITRCVWGIKLACVLWVYWWNIKAVDWTEGQVQNSCRMWPWAVYPP